MYSNNIYSLERKNASRNYVLKLKLEPYHFKWHCIRRSGGRGSVGDLENSNFLNLHSKITENMPQTTLFPRKKFPDQRMHYTAKGLRVFCIASDIKLSEWWGCKNCTRFEIAQKLMVFVVLEFLDFITWLIKWETIQMGKYLIKVLRNRTVNSLHFYKSSMLSTEDVQPEHFTT